LNRFWEQIFGRGLVETVEDFGTKANGLRIPKLLDWLATEFVRQDWDMKAIAANYCHVRHLSPIFPLDAGID